MDEPQPAGGQGKPVGSILREAREARGLALDDAARVTRIGKAYLNALEEGHFDRLPSPAYAKGFLRVYASYLGLSPQEVVDLHERERAADLPRPAEPAAGREEPQGTKGEARGRRALAFVSRRGYLLAVAVVLTAAAFLFLFPGQRREGGDEPRPAPPPDLPRVTAATPAPPPPPAKEEPATDGESAGGQEEGSGEEAFAKAVPAGKGMALKIRVIEDGWLDITIDGAVAQHYELKSGDSIEWKGERGFVLDLGNAGGVEAELNGKALGPLGKAGEKAHVSLRSEDLDR